MLELAQASSDSGIRCLFLGCWMVLSELAGRWRRRPRVVMGVVGAFAAPSLTEGENMAMVSCRYYDYNGKVEDEDQGVVDIIRQVESIAFVPNLLLMVIQLNATLQGRRGYLEKAPP